ncbi:MAG: hypothetical protein HUU35_04400 [Armatimonadetes bacterium]|nr:hypothetical protein [Armatimonadota bacterium]
MMRAMLLLACLPGLVLAQEKVGERPYEMERAGRTHDDQPPFVDFEQLDGWQVKATDNIASFERSRAEQIFGDFVGQLTYRGTGNSPVIMIEPPQPLPIRGAFDTVSLWVRGNAFYRPTPAIPQVDVAVHLAAAGTPDVRIPMTHVNYRYWYLAYRKLTPEQQASLARDAVFTGIEVRGGRQPQDLKLHFDNLAIFQEVLKPLTFEPRPQRGIAMFPGQGSGTNTGPGKLPFPTRPETILPTSLAGPCTATLEEAGPAFVFTYRGQDGVLRYRLEPKTGTWADVSAEWEGRGQRFQPLVGGGVALVGPTGAVPPERAEPLGTRREGEIVVSRWRVSAGDRSAEVQYTYRLWQKSLVIDTKALGGQVAEIRYGRAVGLSRPRLVQIPYYVYTPGRPMVAVSGTVEQPLFLMGNTCWYLSNASQLYGEGDIGAGGVAYNGGARYIPKTDGQRNDVYERFFLTVSPRFEEVLPTVPNPVSPWKDVTGTRVWRAHGAGNRANDAAFWRKAHRHGMRMLVVTDHESMWRDGDESFTFRTEAAPGKGGDEGARQYARIMQDELGFVYGPYNNFTDFAPVNAFWSPDRVARTSDGQLQTAWYRCYAPKPAIAVEFCEKLSPINEQKFGFSTAYCDVHTAVSPWSRTDYDARVPGAGTFAATLYSYGEIMMLQKQAWGGPVYSEGNHHVFLHGCTDGNYAQDQNARLPENPWLVDFDLRALHDLGCNFGMGNLEMFYGRDTSPGTSQGERDAWLDRFLAATIAFGHPGFLVFDGGMSNALRSYYMVQQLAAAYTRASIDTVRYADAAGKLLDTSTAVAAGVIARDQVVGRYDNGTVTVVNGSPSERMQVTVDGKSLDLPPTGYAGWSKDGAVSVFSGETDGHRVDYAVTPAYLYLDGRGRFSRLPKAASSGIAIARRTETNAWEIIPFQGTEAGFDLGAAAASAVALDEQNKELGPAEVRFSRGLLYVMPVAGAFSYLVTPATAAVNGLRSDRDEVVAGETVTVTGQQPYRFQVPGDVRPGERLWQQFEGQWIDFTVRPLADTQLTVTGGDARLIVSSHLPASASFAASFLGQQKTVELAPGVPAELRFALGEARGESLREATVELRAGELVLREPWVLRTSLETVEVAPAPVRFTKGARLREQNETTTQAELTQMRAAVDPLNEASCGNVPKYKTTNRLLLGMHPPYVGGVGYVFARFEPVQLPAAPAAAFRVSVGKRDGSFLGDGVLYRVVVVAGGTETVVAEQAVTDHRWVPLSADLSRWAGQEVSLKVLADVGPGDDSSGDWAVLAEPRYESLEAVPVRAFHAREGRYGSAPPPYPQPDLTVALLRAAKAGRVRYDGANLAGRGQYASYGVLNGVELGEMTPAGGQPDRGVFAERVAIELTPEAIATLGARNQFEIISQNGNHFKVRRFWVELDLADGRKASSRIATATYTQPPTWPYFEGIGVPLGENITAEIWFELQP